jgi:hypothetical protein
MGGMILYIRRGHVFFSTSGEHGATWCPWPPMIATAFKTNHFDWGASQDCMVPMHPTTLDSSWTPLAATKQISER